MVGSVPPNCAFTSANANVSGAGYTTIYTTPAGKSFYWSNLHVCVGSTDNSNARVEVVDATPNLIYQVCFFRVASGQLINQWSNLFPSFKLSEGWAIRVYTSSANITVDITLHGWVYTP